jgi:hypothetical protein
MLVLPEHLHFSLSHRYAPWSNGNREMDAEGILKAIPRHLASSGAQPAITSVTRSTTSGTGEHHVHFSSNITSTSGGGGGGGSSSGGNNALLGGGGGSAAASNPVSRHGSNSSPQRPGSSSNITTASTATTAAHGNFTMRVINYSAVPVPDDINVPLGRDDLIRALSWSVSQVCRYLKTNSLDDLVPVAVYHRIDGRALKGLHAHGNAVQLFQSVGYDVMGPVLALTFLLENLFDPNDSRA